MSHASVKGTPLAVPENVVRLSVGIESAEDLVEDVLEALERV
jgi:cystathionine gamma-synthase